MKYTVFCDGSCIGNPGPGGVGIIIIDPTGKETEYSISESSTTNNRMELSAAIIGLLSIPDGSTIEVYTDSEYTKNGITTWIHAWKTKNWKTARGQPVKNVDLWQMLDQARDTRNVSWFWVKAHNKHPLNERVDKLAYSAASKAK